MMSIQKLEAQMKWTRDYGLGAVGLDVGAQSEVEIESLLYAAIQHAKPVGGRLLQFSGAKEIAGLHDDLESVAEVMGESAYLYR